MSGKQFVLAALVVTSLCGCERTRDKPTKTLRVGYQKWGTFSVLKASGELARSFEPKGIRVEWIEFPAGPPLLEALNAGSIDLGHTGDSPPLFAQAADIPFVYFAVSSASPESSAILVKRESKIRRPADLRGCRLGFAKGTNAHTMVLRYLEKNGLSLSEITPVYLPPSDGRVALEAGSIDAWSIWDPYLAAAEEGGGYRALTTGEGYVDGREFYLASRRIAERQPQLLKDFLKALVSVVAVRPGLVSPTLAYRMAGTFDRQTRGRILINVVTGGDTDELQGDGLFLSHDERYEQTDEFLSIWRGLARGEAVDHTGRHLRVRGARNLFPSFQPHIPLYFGGSSPAAMQVAARHIDLYLTWGERPQQVAEKIACARALAATEGRELRFGIRLHVIVRDTVAEAQREAEKPIQYVTPEIAAEGQRVLAKYESEGQRRMLELQRGGRDGLWLRPDLWAGIGLVRGGAGTAMVGDGATVAALMEEYASLGIDTFILSGYPHLEEAWQFAEDVFPRLSLPRSGNDGRLGEVVANGAVRIPGGGATAVR